MKRHARTALAAGAAFLAIALLTGACRETPTSPPCCFAPPDNLPPSPARKTAVIGTVYGDSRPLEHATVAVANSQVTTDASGRYRLELVGGPPVGTLVSAYHEQFPFQPCAVSAALAQSGSTELTADVSLTSAKGYSATAIRITAGARRVFGTVYAIALDGKKESVADAHVAWESSWDDWKAWSATDSDGRFALCGLPVDRQLSIYAEHSLRLAWASIASGNGDVEIEMILKPIDSETLSASLNHTSQIATH